MSIPQQNDELQQEMNNQFASPDVYENLPISQKIRERIKMYGGKFHASDNIAKFINPGETDQLIDELTTKFEGVIDSLVIDRENDPNSQDTPRRLAKMYINELMSGRYTPSPTVTSFPNIDPERKYQGILIARAEIRSMCSHHHQPVKGVVYIGLLPSDNVIGLSKYTRIAKHCASRGTLQEELAQQILKEIQQHTQCRDVGIYIEATHGCMENRGVMAHSSMTQTIALAGQFFNPSVKNEFMDCIKLQKMGN